MSDETTRRDTGLVSGGRHLPARRALVQRGFALADVLVRRRAEAKRHIDQAWEDWANSFPPTDNPDRSYDEDLQNAILAFNNGVVAIALWLGVEQRSSITDLARELMQEAEWRRRDELEEQKLNELETEYPREGTLSVEPWLRGGMEVLITNIESLSSGRVHLADLGWTGKDLSTGLMSFLEEVSAWVDPSERDSGSDAGVNLHIRSK